MILLVHKALARDQSASLEDWQKLARTGEIVPVLRTGRSWPGLVKLFGFIMGEIGRRLAKF